MFRVLLSLIVAAPLLGAQTAWQLDREPAVSVPVTSGDVVGTLEIPFATTLFEVGTDYLLGRTENADGEQDVVPYHYRR